MTPVFRFAGLAAFALAAIASTAAAQDSGAPVADAFRKNAQRAERNLVAAAEAMPAGKYGFKPTPAQMSFGDVIHHLSQGNDFFCSKIGGVDAPKRTDLPKTAAKNALVSRLKETFQFCDTALEKLDDSKLGGKVPFFGGREITRAAAIVAAAEDWGDHYSQLAIYLRLNGLLPPTAKQKEE
jgi:uncharacterized damage-inducible protein DinB